MKTNRIYSLLACACIAASFTSCASKDDSRAISTPPESVVEPGGTPSLNLPADPIVVNAEKTLAVALHTFKFIAHEEKQHRATFAKVSPAIHVYVENIRRNSPGWLATAEAMKTAYKKNRSAANKANMLTAISTVSTALDQSKRYLEMVGYGNP